jgi:hypothetical protein
LDFKPSLEQLESRTLLASSTLIWNAGSDGPWSNPNDWKDSVTGAPATPKNGDILIFDGTKQTKATDDMSGLTYISSLQVNANYTSEIDINNPLTIGTADGTTSSGVASGLGGGEIAAIKMVELFTNSTFNATGGKLWSTDTFQVDSGANLNFTGTGTTLQKLTLTNNGNVDLNTTGDVHVQDITATNNGNYTIEGGQSVVEDGVSSTFTNQTGGTLLKKGLGTTSNLPFSFTNAGGTLTLNQGTTLKFTTSASQSSGTTFLDKDSNLWTLNGYTMDGGTLNTAAGSTTITGNLTVNGGTVALGQSGTSGGIGTLNVTGNCTLGVNSTYYLDVAVANGVITGCDQLAVNTAGGGTVELDGGGINYNFLHDDPMDNPANGQTANIILFRSLTGDFNNFNWAYPGGHFRKDTSSGTTYQLVAVNT